MVFIHRRTHTHAPTPEKQNDPHEQRTRVQELTRIRRKRFHDARLSHHVHLFLYTFLCLVPVRRVHQRLSVRTLRRIRNDRLVEIQRVLCVPTVFPTRGIFHDDVYGCTDTHVIRIAW